ncbi:unnamed protein product [Auanema sp. JU1783]|nr:unnamed protein product [Auanema sp. JU1783]
MENVLENRLEENEKAKKERELMCESCRCVDDEDIEKDSSEAVPLPIDSVDQLCEVRVLKTQFLRIENKFMLKNKIKFTIAGNFDSSSYSHTNDIAALKEASIFWKSLLDLEISDKKKRELENRL